MRVRVLGLLEQNFDGEISHRARRLWSTNRKVYSLGYGL